MTAPTLDRETILQTVQKWPLEDQIALADAILALVRAHKGLESPMALRGIAATGHPAPSDEDVARILEEERMQKYGH